MTIVAAALIPGMPHMLGSEPATSWQDLRTAAEVVGEPPHGHQQGGERDRVGIENP